MITTHVGGKSIQHAGVVLYVPCNVVQEGRGMCPQHHKRADSMMLGCDARVGGMISVLATSAPGPRRRQKPRERPPPRSAAQPHDRRHLVALGTVTTSDVLGRSGRSGCNAPSPRFCVAPRPITARRAIGSCPAPNSVSRSRSAAAIYLSAHGTRTRGARDGSSDQWALAWVGGVRRAPRGRRSQRLVGL